MSRPTNGSAVVLKTRTRSGPSGSGATSIASPDLGSRAVDRRLLGRRREVADDRVEEAAEADPLRGAADEDRRQERVADAAVEARVELGVADLLALEVLGHDVVVGLGRGLEQLVAAEGHLGLELGRDRDLDLLLAVPAVGLAVDEVDVAAERLGLADRELERRDLRPELLAERVEHGGRVGVLAVALVDEEERCGPVRPPEGDRRLGPGLDAAGRVDADERGVDGLEARRRPRPRSPGSRACRRASRGCPRRRARRRRGTATCAASAPRARSRGSPSRPRPGPGG